MARTQVPEEGQRVVNVSELKNTKPRSEAVIRTEGKNVTNDGLSNLYWWDPNGNPSNADGKTIIESNVSGYQNGEANEGVWRRMFKPSSEIESQIEKSAGNQGAVQYSDGSGGFLGDANYLYVDNSNGNVGVGTSNPSAKLEIESDGNGAGDAISVTNSIDKKVFELNNNGQITLRGAGGGLRTNDNITVPTGSWVGNSVNANTTYNGGQVDLNAANDVRVNINGPGNKSGTFFAVYENGRNGSGNELFRVQQDGNVGIGTDSPSSALDVNGNINAQQDVIISGALNVQDFTFDQNSGDLVLSDSNGVELIRQPEGGSTQFIQGAEIGSIETPADAFTQVINAPSTSAASSGGLVGYTFAVDNSAILEVLADADGSGGVTNKRISFPSDTEFAGAGDGLVSNNGNLDVRLPIDNAGSNVTTAYALNFGGALNALDDGSNQVTIQHDNTSSQGNVSTGGATVIDNINVDGYGHVTNMNTQNRRLSDWLAPTSALNISDETLQNVGSINIDDFTFDQNSGDLVLTDDSGVELIRQPKAGPTEFVQGISLGSIEAPEDSLTQMINASSTSAASSGDPVGYTFAVDNQSFIEVSAESDGSGGIQNGSVSFKESTKFEFGDVVEVVPSDDEPLKVGSSGSINPTMSIGGNEITTRDSVLYLNNDVNNDIYLATGGGNVGIGTNSPGSKLDVDGNAAFRNGSERVYAGNFADIDPQNRSGSYPAIAADNVLRIAARMEVWGNGNGNYIDVRDNGGNVSAEINANSNSYFGNNGNNVGIGTTSPSNKLSVNGDIRISSYGDHLWFGSGDPMFIKSVNSGNNTTDLQIGRNFSFDASDQVFVTVNDDGEVGIGTTNPSYALDVNGGVAVDNGMNFSNKFDIEYNSNSESLDFIYTG